MPNLEGDKGRLQWAAGAAPRGGSSTSRRRLLPALLDAAIITLLPASLCGLIFAASDLPGRHVGSLLVGAALGLVAGGSSVWCGWCRDHAEMQAAHDDLVARMQQEYVALADSVRQGEALAAYCVKKAHNKKGV